MASLFVFHFNNSEAAGHAVTVLDKASIPNQHHNNTVEVTAEGEFFSFDDVKVIADGKAIVLGRIVDLCSIHQDGREVWPVDLP